ncbi:MAG: hypothetical protein DSY81_00320 [Bacillota bacterium]|nr:MAG: hypothetical protein DSY92_02015 [Planctomycetota bacterium]RUA11526.1 MAG: hypothetical protein DSY81_00320 [Bacillota bacterium]
MDPRAQPGAPGRVLQSILSATQEPHLVSTFGRRSLHGSHGYFSTNFNQHHRPRPAIRVVAG